VDKKDCQIVSLFSVALLLVGLSIGKCFLPEVFQSLFFFHFLISFFSFIFFQFFLFGTFHQLHPFVARLSFMKNHNNHFSIDVDFIWLVTWLGVERVVKKRDAKVKNMCDFIFFVLNEDHQPNVVKSSQDFLL